MKIWILNKKREKWPNLEYKWLGWPRSLILIPACFRPIFSSSMRKDLRFGFQGITTTLSPLRSPWPIFPPFRYLPIFSPFRVYCKLGKPFPSTHLHSPQEKKAAFKISWKFTQNHTLKNNGFFDLNTVWIRKFGGVIKVTLGGGQKSALFCLGLSRNETIKIKTVFSRNLNIYMYNLYMSRPITPTPSQTTNHSNWRYCCCYFLYRNSCSSC